ARRGPGRLRAGGTVYLGGGYRAEIANGTCPGRTGTPCLLAAASPIVRFRSVREDADRVKVDRLRLRVLMRRIRESIANSALPVEFPRCHSCYNGINPSANSGRQGRCCPLSTISAICRLESTSALSLS